MNEKSFTEEEILEAYKEHCKVLEKHGLPVMSLEEFKESLNHPLNEDSYPPLYKK